MEIYGNRGQKSEVKKNKRQKTLEFRMQQKIHIIYFFGKNEEYVAGILKSAF